MIHTRETLSVKKIVGLSYADKLREKILKKYSIKVLYQSSSSFHDKTSADESILTKLYLTFCNARKIICSGSAVEGNAAANHFRQDKKLQDFDYMIEIGRLYSDEQILPVQNAPGFVLVKWAYDDETAYLPHDDGFVNGFQIKKLYAEYVRQQGFFFDGRIDTKPESASVQCAMNFDMSRISSSLHDALQYIETIEQNEIKRRNFLAYCRCCKDYMKIECSKFADFPITMLSDDQYYEDVFSLLSPAFGFQLSNDQRARIEQILDFYFKYGLDINPVTLHRLFSEQVQPELSSVDLDLVPSLKLEFWPHNMQWFLERLKRNRPLLFEKIEPLHMHIVPKWSGQTISKEMRKTLQFRYSYSLIEIKLAEQRSPIEQILNRVARGLFYKYIHKSAMATSLSSVEQYVPSYFVKTTVLWMCETIDLDHIYTLMIADDSRKEKLLADRLAKRWIEYVCPILESTICPHYFIKDLNILDGYSKQYLDELAFILQNNVDLDDEHVPYSQLNTSNHNDKTMKYQNQLEKLTIELMNQPDFIQDCITLCADTPLDENFIKMLVSEEDDNSGTDDEDVYISISAVLQGLLLLQLMASYDDSNRNNWQLWKKLIISDVSHCSPILHSDRKFMKENVLYLIQIMGVVIGAKSIDSLLTHRELDTILKSTLLSPLLNLSNLLKENVTRTYPLLSQLIMSQIHSRPVTQDPSKNVNQLIDIFQDSFTVLSEFFCSNRARMFNILIPEIMETASQTDFMKDESTIREEITSENQVLGKHRIRLESIPDIELD